MTTAKAKTRRMLPMNQDKFGHVYITILLLTFSRLF